MQRFVLTFIFCLIVAPTLAQAQEQDAKTTAPAKKADDKKADDKKADDKKAEAAKEEPKDFASVFKTFKGLEDEINEIAKKYSQAPAAEREELMKHYQEHIVEIREMLPKLRTVALAEYTENPNKDEEVSKTLVGLLANHVRNDQYEDGLQIAELMVKNKCEIKDVHNFAGAAYYCTEQFEKAKEHLTAAKEAKVLDSQGSQFLGEIDNVMANWKVEKAIRAKEAKSDNLPRVKLTTSKGAVTIELLENEAPQAVANFVSLVEKKFYDNLTFHRVLPGFMAQAGCPEGTGSGGPGYNIYCECQKEGYRKHFRGTLSMAHAGKDTGGSQFFLTFRPTTHLDGRHTVFGRVVEGMEVLAKIQRRDPQRRGQPAPDRIVKAEVLRKQDHEYKPTKVK